MHEIQHVIQRKEGFARGANYHNPPIPEAVKDYFPTKEGDLVPSWVQQSQKDMPKFSKDSLDHSLYQTYRRSAGEAEAFNVTDRRAKHWKYLMHPEDTEFVGRGLQYVTHGKAGGGSVGNFNPERASAFGLAKQGMINSNVPGRTDKLNMDVPTGSYVIPADIPSAIGQGNSAAGGAILDKMFNKGPYGMNIARAKGGVRVGKRMTSLGKPNKRGFAEGGGTEATPIIAAGGEYMIYPETVAALGNGDMDLGHSILDSFVKQVRSKHITTLKGLKPPKGSS